MEINHYRSDVKRLREYLLHLGNKVKIVKQGLDSGVKSRSFKMKNNMRSVSID